MDDTKKKHHTKEESAAAPADAVETAEAEVVVEPEIATVVETTESVRAELMDRILRLQADFDNFRRRTRQERDELSAMVSQGFIRELLPVIDNFERALASRPAEDATGFAVGVDMIFRQFSAMLDKHGVKAIETVGQVFDPSKHEAVLRVEDPNQPEGTIVEELQKGYQVGGKVLRPAMVKVSGK